MRNEMKERCTMCDAMNEISTGKFLQLVLPQVALSSVPIKKSPGS